MFKRRRFVLPAIVAAAGAGMAVCQPHMAAAAVTRTAICPAKPSACTVAFTTAPTTIRGMVDKAGTSSRVITWRVTYRGTTVCSGTYRPVEPPKAWPCSRIRGGIATFTTPGSPGPTRITITSGGPIVLPT